MGSVRTASTPHPRDLYVSVPPASAGGSRRAGRRGVKPGWRRTLVLDVLCVVGILALAAIVALIGRGVEKL